MIMYSLPGMILLYLAVPFFTPKVFLHEIQITEKVCSGMYICIAIYVAMHIVAICYCIINIL